MSRGGIPELQTLRALFELCDPAPPGVLGAAYAAMGQLGSLSGDPALELVGDSGDEPVRSRIRAGKRAVSPRVLTFTMPGRIVEMDLVTTTPGTFRANGLVLSRAGQGVPAGELVSRHPEGRCASSLDDHGGFCVDDVPRGPVSVAFHPAQSAPVVADWMVC